MKRSALIVLSLSCCSIAAAVTPSKAKHNVVTVRESGGDYTDPIAAAANAFQGDTWCVGPRPARPCVIDVGAGLFILHDTLTLPRGLVLRGQTLDETLLVAALGVPVAVDALDGAITDLTIINRQPGAPEAIGLRQISNDEDTAFALRLRRLAIHTEGAITNTSVYSYFNLDIAGCDFSAEGGQNALTIQHFDLGNLTARRLNVTATAATVSNTALVQDYDDRSSQLRLYNSHLRAQGPRATAIADNTESSILEVQGGDLTAITNAGLGEAVRAIDEGINILLTGTHIVGNVSAWFSVPSVIDGISMQGGLSLSSSTYNVLRSYITGAVGADDAHVTIESSFVRDVASFNDAAVAVRSSVVTQTVTTGNGGTLSCENVLDGNYAQRAADCTIPTT